MDIKGTCDYEYKQGKKKGTICGSSCRGQKCKMHKETNIGKQKEYRDKKRIEKTHEGLVANRCRYIFGNGPKRLTMCGKSCRGTRCFIHKDKNRERKKEYYKEKKEELENQNNEEKRKELFDEGFKLRKLYNEAKKIIIEFRNLKVEKDKYKDNPKKITKIDERMTEIREIRDKLVFKIRKQKEIISKLESEYNI